MKNSANDAKRMWLETGHLNDQIDYVAMDSKADDYDLFREMDRQRKVTLITSCRKTKSYQKTVSECLKLWKNQSTNKFTKSDHIVLSQCKGSLKTYSSWTVAG